MIWSQRLQKDLWVVTLGPFFPKIADYSLADIFGQWQYTLSSRLAGPYVDRSFPPVNIVQAQLPDLAHPHSQARHHEYHGAIATGRDVFFEADCNQPLHLLRFQVPYVASSRTGFWLHTRCRSAISAHPSLPVLRALLGVFCTHFSWRSRRPDRMLDATDSTRLTVKSTSNSAPRGSVNFPVLYFVYNSERLPGVI